MFSMPAGSPPDNVLGAVKNFAREQFALAHRYAMVLHTDEPHPHRVAANATERSVRGITEPRKLNRIYRPAHPKPGETPRFSTHMRRREDALRAELRSGSLRVEPGKAK